MWNITPNTLSCTDVLYIDDIFAIWCGPKGTLLEFLNALNSKTDRIKVTYCISESSISFRDLFLYRDTSSNVNKYLYIPFESFHPSRNIKKAFIKEELMWYVRNSSSFNSFSETRESSGSDYELGGIHSDFCFHCFVKYDTVTERNGFTRSLTTHNYDHANIENVISTILPKLD